MRFYQVISAVLTLKLLDFLYDRTNGFFIPLVQVVALLMVWMLISALFWVLAFYTFRAVDARNER